MTDTAPPAKTPAAAIYALTIERFRGITSLKWKPSRGVNVILGGGDVGKTTILEAIALLLSPVNPTTLSDPDYHDRQIEVGFSIEAVLSLPAGAGISSQMKPSWPWEWSGEEATVPSLEHDGRPPGEPVYRVRVRGAEDRELGASIELILPEADALDAIDHLCPIRLGFDKALAGRVDQHRDVVKVGQAADMIPVARRQSGRITPNLSRDIVRICDDPAPRPAEKASRDTCDRPAGALAPAPPRRYDCGSPPREELQ